MEKMKLDIQRFAVSVQFTNIEETDINIADNTSKLKFDIEIITSGATYNNSGTAYYKVTIKYRKLRKKNKKETPACVLSGSGSYPSP